MRVLFDNHLPFMLGHGGAQTQIEQTKAGVEQQQIEADWLRWWDGDQQADLLHCWCVPGEGYLAQARMFGIPIVATILLTTTCNRPPLRLALQGAAIRFLQHMPGARTLFRSAHWNHYNALSRILVGIEAERSVLIKTYGVDPGKVVVIPLGLGREFLEAGAGSRDADYLITTGTITERKRSVELAEMALASQVPILFVGKPYSPDDAYWKRFSALVDGRIVRHHPHVGSVAEMIRLLQGARGFVIYSRWENWCLSAHEAAACGLPVLLPDLPWSRERFGPQASYLNVGVCRENPARLRGFYEACPSLPSPRIDLYGWDEVGRRIAAVYREVCDEVRPDSARISR